MLKGQLFRVAWPQNSWTVHFPSCLSGASAAPQLFLLTAAT